MLNFLAGIFIIASIGLFLVFLYLFRAEIISKYQSGPGGKLAVIVLAGILLGSFWLLIRLL